MMHPTQILDVSQIGNAVFFPVGRDTRMSVAAYATDTAWGTAVLTIKWAYQPGAPTFAFDSSERSAATVGPGTGGIAWIDVRAKPYLAVEVTTAEGASEVVGVSAFGYNERELR